MKILLLGSLIMAVIVMGCSEGGPAIIEPPCGDHLPVLDLPECGCTPTVWPPCPPKKRCLFDSTAGWIVVGDLSE